MSFFKRLIPRQNIQAAESAIGPQLWNYEDATKLDEETVYTICRLINTVGFQIKSNWDWNWMEKAKGNYRSLLSHSMMNAAWKVLAEKHWLSLQTVNDETRKITTIAPVASLANLETVVIQNNLITDLEPLSGMSRLKVLNCFANRIVELAPLIDLPLLEKLVLGNNPIRTLTALENLPNLRTLNISTDQVECLTQCKRLHSLQVLDIYGDGSVENLADFPDMPTLRVLRVHNLKDVAGIERFDFVRTLHLSDGGFSRLDGVEKLKDLTHIKGWSSQPINLRPLSGLFGLRCFAFNAPQIHELLALAGLPVLHEIRISDDSKCDRTELNTLCSNLIPWNNEYESETNKASPSLEIEIVSEEEFDRYDTAGPFGILPGECEDGMFHSERTWLQRELADALKVNFEEGYDNDFWLRGITGFRRSEAVALYSLRAYESTREIVAALQKVLCRCRNDWVIYFQSLLTEGPDAEELPSGIKDFTAWIYPDKILVKEAEAATIRKLIDWE